MLFPGNACKGEEGGRTEGKALLSTAARATRKPRGVRQKEKEE